MNRPNIRDFFSEDMTPQMLNNLFLEQPELYGYISAQDIYIDDLESQTAKGGQAEVQVSPLIWWEIIPKDLSDLTGNCVGRYLTKEDAEYNLNHFFGDVEDFRIVKIVAG